jgi:hypothetical protein
MVCSLAISLYRQKDTKKLVDANRNIFISSDDEASRNTLFNCFKTQNVTSFFHPISLATVDTAGNPSSFENSLKDLYTLSKCQTVVATYMSTFGPVAAALGDSKLFVAMPPANFLDNSHVSFWGSSISEPCFWRARALIPQLKLSDPGWNMYHHLQCCDAILKE